MLIKVFKKLANADLVVAGIALISIIIFTFFSVIMRYFVNRPVHWGEEFQLLCMLIIALFGAGAAFRTASHVAIDVIVDLFPWKAQRFISITVYLISMIIMGYFFIQGTAFVRQMIATGRVTDILRIPFSLIYSAFPIGCALIIVNYSVVTFFKYIKPGGKEVFE
ncbi:MAG: TRAP transporter small permease [Treponema sp.]|nr:TRAP transporter small permease [Treponema sp.]